MSTSLQSLLKAGKIGGAGLDVMTPEPLGKSQPLSLCLSLLQARVTPLYFYLYLYSRKEPTPFIFIFIFIPGRGHPHLSLYLFQERANPPLFLSLSLFQGEATPLLLATMLSSLPTLAGLNFFKAQNKKKIVIVSSKCFVYRSNIFQGTRNTIQPLFVTIFRLQCFGCFPKKKISSTSSSSPNLQRNNWRQNRDGCLGCSKSSRWTQRASTAWTYHWMREIVHQKDKDNDKKCRYNTQDKDNTNDNVNTISPADSNHWFLAAAVCTFSCN